MFNTGVQRPVFWPGLVIVVAGGVLGWLVAGMPGGLDLPEKTELNVVGGGSVTPEFLTMLIGLTVYTAAYIAEIVRGGLQAVPRGQHEAADAIGLSFFQKQRKIILPQALRMVIPPLVGNFIGLFKSTTLVVVIGLFDLLNSAKAALTDLNWRGFSIELYIFTAAVYFVFCYSMSKYSQSLERDLNKGTRR